MEKLRRLRTDRRLSQARLAARAELDPSTVNQIERGAREASPATLRKLADALDVGIAELLGDGSPKAQSRSSREPSLFNGLEGERHIPSLRSWIDLAGRMADRWEAEFEEREAEWQAAEPHIKKSVKLLPNLNWAMEIFRTYTDILAAVNTELHHGLYVYETAEVQELFKNTQRLEKVWERTKPWYPGKEAPRTAEVIDLKQAMVKRVEEIEARSSQSA